MKLHPNALHVEVSGSGKAHGNVGITVTGPKSVNSINVRLVYRSRGYSHHGDWSHTYKGNHVHLVLNVTDTRVWGKTWLRNGSYVVTYGMYEVLAQGSDRCSHTSGHAYVMNNDPG